jgi:mannosyl-oligosaccharide alpha-1,2-mannosidase
LLLLVILITVCVLYYIYQKDVPLSHDISSPPPSYADDIKQQPQPQQPAEAAIADKLEEQELLEEFEEQHILEDEIDPIKEKPAAAQQQPSTPFLFTQTPPPEALHPQDPTMAEKQQRVVDAFRHAWKGYSNDIFGMDEYRPISHSGSNWAPGGVGLMICDSLDTMMLMNLTDEYNQAREWIATELDFDKDQDVNVFETTIRVLGGLLSAYHLSNNDPLYLEKAIDLGNRLYPAFNTPSGVPYSGVVLSNGRGASPGSSSTAEATTVQMEFKYLSHLSGDKKFWDAAEKVMDHVATLSHTLPALDGLVPIYIE